MVISSHKSPYHMPHDTMVSRQGKNLTHGGRNKMADDRQTAPFKCTFLNENLCILIRISFNFITEGLTDKKSALVQIMAWHKTMIWMDDEQLKASCMKWHIDGLVQERRNSTANALELRLSCTNTSINTSSVSIKVPSSKISLASEETDLIYVLTVLTDGPAAVAPVGARTSAGTERTKTWTYICTGSVLECYLEIINVKSLRNIIPKNPLMQKKPPLNIQTFWSSQNSTKALSKYRRMPIWAYE